MVSAWYSVGTNLAIVSISSGARVHLLPTQVERGNKMEKRLPYRIPRLLQPVTDTEAAIEMNYRHQHHRQPIVFICLFYSDSETMAS